MAPAHADSFVRTGRNTDPELRLVCFPHAGGAPSTFRTWADRLPDGVELLSVCYPGRHNRFTEPNLSRMDALADQLAEALLPELDTPVALFGHSMGAAVAYEVTVRLEQRYGISPVRLFVSGRPAPRRPRAADSGHTDTDAPLDRVNQLGNELVELLDVPELLDCAIATLWEDYELVETSQPPAPTRVSCPMVGYVGEQDTDCPPEEVRAWAELTEDDYEFRSFPGGHFYLEQREPELVADLVGQLQGATAGGGRHV
jgi:pyochelin biosynthetic protein PchC